MKLLRARRDHLVFEISRDEKRLLFEILKLYPLVSETHHRLSRKSNIVQPKDHQRLLDESLADQRKENQKNVQVLLNEPGRFDAAPPGFHLKITRPEIEWLLQVLNDIRVGSWIALGSPDPESGKPAVYDEKTVPRYQTMELAGAFEMVFLEALTGQAQVG